MKDLASKKISELRLEIIADEEYGDPVLEIRRMPIVGMTTKGAHESKPRVLTREDIDNGRYYYDATRKWEGYHNTPFISYIDLRQWMIAVIENCENKIPKNVLKSPQDTKCGKEECFNSKKELRYSIVRCPACSRIKHCFEITEEDLSHDRQLFCTCNNYYPKEHAKSCEMRYRKKITEDEIK